MDVVLLSRLQFAMTVMFHYIFPPLTIGMGVVLVYTSIKSRREEDARAPGVENRPRTESAPWDDRSGERRDRPGKVREESITVTFSAEDRERPPQAVGPGTPGKRRRRRALRCPECGGTRLDYEAGYITGQYYLCKDCSYRGSFVIELDPPY